MVKKLLILFHVENMKWKVNYTRKSKESQKKQVKVKKEMIK